MSPPSALRAEPPELATRLRDAPGPAEEAWVAEIQRRLGRRLAEWEQPALLLDPLRHGAPIVGASKGVEALLKRSAVGVLGASWRILLEGIGQEEVSRSTCQDVEDFLRMSRLRCVASMADCAVLLPLCRPEGERVRIGCCFRFVKADERGVEGKAGGEPQPMVLALLSQDSVFDWSGSGSDSDSLFPRTETLPPELKAISSSPAWSPSPLSNKCILLNGLSTVMRREPHQVPRGCIAMSHNEVHAAADSSYSFTIRVDQTLTSWSTRMPFVGFTCTPPQEIAASRCFYGPLPHAFCLGEAAVIGGTGEAWMRTDAQPLVPRVGRPLEKDAQRRHLTPHLAEHRRAAPFALRSGDLLSCRYRRCGHSAACAEQGTSAQSRISLFINGDLAFEFNLDGHLPACKPLYAVVDVCYAVYQVTLLPNSADPWPIA